MNTRTKMQSCTTTGIRIVDLDTLSAAMSASRSRDPKSRLHVPPYCARQHISQVLKNVWRPTRTKNFNITATETKQILPPFWNENHLEYYIAAKISFINFSIKTWKTVTSLAVDGKWFTENCSYLKFLQMQKTPSLKSLWQSTVGRNILKLVVIWDDFFILMIWNFRISRNNSIEWILVVKWCFLSRDLPMYPVFQW